MAHLLLDGSANSDADAPYIAAYDIAGDLDVRVRLSADDWTPATDFLNPISRWGGAVNVFQFQLRSSGALRCDLRDAAAAPFVAQSTATVGFTDGQAGWIRFTLDVDNGSSQYEVKFYTSPDGETPSWTQLGATVVGAGAKVLETGAALMTVGSRTNGGWWDGKIYRAQVLDGIGGSLVFDADPSDTSTWDCPDKLSFTDKANSATVTLQGNASLVGDCPSTGNRMGGTGAIRKPPRYAT